MHPSARDECLHEREATSAFGYFSVLVNILDGPAQTTSDHKSYISAHPFNAHSMLFWSFMRKLAQSHKLPHHETLQGRSLGSLSFRIQHKEIHVPSCAHVPILRLIVLQAPTWSMTASTSPLAPPTGAIPCQRARRSLYLGKNRKDARASML